MLPLKLPCRQRRTTRGQNVVDNPNNSMDIDKPNGPIKRTGLRPNLSDKYPHWMALKHSAKKKADSYKTKDRINPVNQVYIDVQ
jgi:hypothetical protein